MSTDQSSQTPEDDSYPPEWLPARQRPAEPEPEPPFDLTGTKPGATPEGHQEAPDYPPHWTNATERNH